MKRYQGFRWILIILTAFVFTNAFSQSMVKLKDGFDSPFCDACSKQNYNRPKEVLYGITITDDGRIFFSMNNIEWFNKIFIDDNYGVSVDVVSRSRYDCNKPFKNTNNTIKGYLMPITTKKVLLNRSTMTDEIFSEIGTLPLSLAGKELEGNFIITYKDSICSYQSFVDISRSNWQLLPMGLYTDKLMKQSAFMMSDYEKPGFYSQTIKLEFPFSKGSAAFNDDYLKKVYDSIQLFSSIIRKADIRAYSSVEGSLPVNKRLMGDRAGSITKALNKYQSTINSVNIVTAENWIDFYEDIKTTEFEDFSDLSKSQIKQKLANPAFAKQLEPILAKHRKVIVTLYLSDKTRYSKDGDSSLIIEFQNAITNKSIAKAQVFLKEIANRVSDKRLPEDYLNKLEIPKSKEFTSLLNDREVYKYSLKNTEEYEVLNNFLEIRKLDPGNGKLNYNICALRFFVWQYSDDSLSKAVILSEINNLTKQNIHPNLVTRMKINYHILKSEDQMKILNYKGKDSSINEIRKIYKSFKPIDEEIYSLAKFYTYYSHRDWAEEIIEPRLNDINISEDLVFYYLNLLFFKTGLYETDAFRSAILNAINLNKQRYCSFFKSIDRGGASMQLLEDEYLRKIYCEECRN